METLHRPAWIHMGSLFINGPNNEDDDDDDDESLLLFTVVAALSLVPTAVVALVSISWYWSGIACRKINVSNNVQPATIDGSKNSVFVVVVVVVVVYLRIPSSSLSLRAITAAIAESVKNIVAKITSCVNARPPKKMNPNASSL
jgi:hypothetical protein